jgi:hypothetical protein
MSALRRDLDDYLVIRRALGFKLERAGLVLANFVAHLEANEADTITTDAALAWATLPPNGASNWWAQRLSVVRGFARHLHAIDPTHEVPPPGLLPGRSHRATPYLYSDSDIAALMAAARGLQRRGEQGAGQCADERPPRGHWMTSSARPSTDCGIVSPSALAVLTLMTSSNLVGCSTGRSPGLAPLRILST